MRTLGLVLALASTSLLGCGRDNPPASTTPTTTSTTAAASTTTGAAPAANAAPAPTTAAAPGEVTVGKTAPSFSATTFDGKDVKIDALKGKNVVVYFYPKDETPGCTKEACSFRDAWKDLSATGVVLVGISADDAESHKKFAEHHKLPFMLVTDKDGAISSAYGVPKFGRQTFVIGPDGNVKKIYRSVDVSKHASEVLADVKS